MMQCNHATLVDPILYGTLVIVVFCPVCGRLFAQKRHWRTPQHAFLAEVRTLLPRLKRVHINQCGPGQVAPALYRCSWYEEA
jgi:hypothetical protein